MNDEQEYLAHLDQMDEDTVGNWNDYFAAFHKTMYPIAAQYGMSFGESILLFKLNQVYNALCNKADQEDEYK